MQVNYKVDVKYMQTNFGGHGLFGIGNFFAHFLFAFKMANFLSDHGLYPWGSKIESAQKFHASRG